MATITIDAAFDLGNRILTERGWNKNAHGDWITPGGRPVRLRATPDHKGGNLDQCVQLELVFAQLTGEPSYAVPRNEVLWAR